MDDYGTSLIRLLCGQLHTLLLMTRAQEKHGKSLFDLTEDETKHLLEGIDATVALAAARFDPTSVEQMLKVKPSQLSKLSKVQ